LENQTTNSDSIPWKTKQTVLPHYSFATRRHLVVIVEIPFRLTFFFFVLGFFVFGVASESPLKHLWFRRRKFWSQKQDINVSLTEIGLMVKKESHLFSRSHFKLILCRCFSTILYDFRWTYPSIFIKNREVLRSSMF
jgi:hypothetical protein